MSYLDRQYISLITGEDFSPYIHNQDDLDKFQKMCELQEKCVGLTAGECIEDIVDALNLSRELKGISQRVKYIGKQNPQMN